MDKIKLRFTDNIIKKSKEKTPKLVKEKYVVDNNVSYKYGYVRFDEGKLKSIYIYPNGYELDDSWYSVLFKFDLQNNNLIFKYVYDFIEDSNNNTFTEGRYDKNMNIESKYTHYDKRIPAEEGKLFCSKEKEGRTINYIFKDKPKQFYEHLKNLERNNIIVNNSNHYYCYWGEKQNLNVEYLVITT